MFRYIALALSAVLITACGGSETADLTGSWETVEDAPVTMTAFVSEGVMEIALVQGTTHGVYWKGTVPAEVTAGDIFVSEGDTEAMDASILGSGLETKEFTYASDSIIFEFTVLGVTQTVTMERLN